MKAVLIAIGVFTFWSEVAAAAPVINILYDPNAGFSALDQSVIQNAIQFYTAGMTSNFSVTIAFSSQSSGGGTSEFLLDSESYNAYYNALAANSSGDATDGSAVASLGGGSHLNNPVTGSPDVTLSTTLASALGLSAQSSSSFSNCGALIANACIALSQAALNASGAPLAGLNAIVQHEVDEVLGTFSALPNGGGSVPSDPAVADLYRYSAPGVRSFALNTSTTVPCSGAPTAYLSVNGGATNLNDYNNCNNGGDYGDWIGTSGAQVQDAFGPDTQAAALTLSSPEVTLLDAVGYNFTAQTAVPEPQTIAAVLGGLALLGALRLRFQK